MLEIDFLSSAMQTCTNIHAHIVSIIISLCMNPSYVSLPRAALGYLVLDIQSVVFASHQQVPVEALHSILENKIQLRIRIESG